MVKVDPLAEIVNREPSENDWAKLWDEDTAERTRQQAEQKYGHLTAEQVRYLRVRAKKDLFFLAYGILGYDLLSKDLHLHLCRWLRRMRGVRYRAILLPRGHYKSTIVTIAEAIQMALPNDAGVEAHPYCLGPNIKVLIGHENRESASRFLFEITEAFVRNPLMMAIFPELVPSRKGGQRMNKWELELPRGAHHKEPTFDTIGTGGAAQGRHYNWLKLDDLIGEDARESETVMGRALDWFDNINSLLTRMKIDGWDLVGTHWAVNDLYWHAMHTYGIAKDQSFIRALREEQVEKIPEGQLATYDRGVVENEEPIFPEEFSEEDIERLRRNPKVFAAQYANNPLDSGLTKFDPKHLRYYNVVGDEVVVFTKRGSWRKSIWDMDRVIMVDPSVGESSGSDESGIMVTGTDDQMNIYVLETVKEILDPPALVDKIFDLTAKWSPRVVSFEEVSFSAVYKYWVREKQERMGLHIPWEPYKRPGGRNRKNKNKYIEALTHYFAAGQVFIAEGMHHFRDEYEWFPMTDSKHLLDAMSQGPEVWAEGLSGDRWEDYRQEEQTLLEQRDALTGY